MKIFCKTRDNVNRLDRFVGKDVWVKCRLWIGGNHWSYNDFWVKFISSDDTTYDVIAAICLEEDGGLREKTARDRYNGSKYIRTRNKENIRLVTPIEVLTTDELFSLDPKNPEDIEQEASEED